MCVCNELEKGNRFVKDFLRKSNSDFFPRRNLSYHISYRGFAYSFFSVIFRS